VTSPSDPTPPDSEAGAPPAGPSGQYGQHGQYGQYGQPVPPRSPYGEPMPAPGVGDAYGGYGAPAADRPQIAGMGDRLVARIIDTVLVCVGAVVLLIPGAIALGVSVDETTGEPTPGGIVAFLAVLAVVVLLAVMYEIAFIAVRGRTIGKQVMKLTVRLEADGRLPGWGPSLVRWLIPAVAGAVTFLIGGIGQLLVYVSPFFDNTGRRQGWHDKAARTLVVKEANPRAGGQVNW
jgi:uncharacterized RDD family membrane protein YckC